MSRRMRLVRRFALATAAPALLLVTASAAFAQQRTAQPNDEEYTKKIKEYLQDPRITTELVDHLPASSTVPTPLKFLGRIVGTPGELTYAKDIYRYFDALDAASDRIKVWRIVWQQEVGTIRLTEVLFSASRRQVVTQSNPIRKAPSV